MIYRVIDVIGRVIVVIYRVIDVIGRVITIGSICITVLS